jgi:tRNA pseudouridine55 synthase
VRRDFHGVLCLDKPAGMTSFAAVLAARRRLGAIKAGHAGTLDPLATGVLPICFGEATKLTQFLVDHEKVYRATLVFGAETDTGDAEGRVVAEGDAGSVSRAALKATTQELVGRIAQEVPAYSAVRVAGERLYARARRGEAVHGPIREVEISSLEVLEFAPPRATLEVRCGRGTYLRALATEIGRRLGCRAHLGALRRLRVGIFRIEESVTIDSLDPEHTPLWGLREALGPLPEQRLDDASAARLLRSGLPPPDLGGDLPPGLRIFTDAAGHLLAVARVSDKMCRMLRVFHPPACIPSRVVGRDAVRPTTAAPKLAR